MQKIKNLNSVIGNHSGRSERMPVLFIGHGNPMNAIEKNEFSEGWARVAGHIGRPRAILVISAHWQTHGTWVTAMEKPKTIHDFWGFPDALYRQQYPAPGAPHWAREVTERTRAHTVGLTHDWGLDHGAWSVLLPMFPAADIPVFQMSLDLDMAPVQHYEMARDLAFLREKGVLVIGSGNIVHNLRMMTWEDMAYDWALEFDHTTKQLIEKGDHHSLIRYERLSTSRLAVPTHEHYLPLLYSLALRRERDHLTFFNDRTTAGSISMRCVLFS